VVEAVQGSPLTSFLEHLKEAVNGMYDSLFLDYSYKFYVFSSSSAVCGQNSALGLQATYEWIEKYASPLVQSNTPLLTSPIDPRTAMDQPENPFTDDFDPFRPAGQSAGCEFQCLNYAKCSQRKLESN
jgi:hypothetical protein